MQETLAYQNQSRAFLNQAYEELASDLPQASEKAWGAASQIIKAVAQERGWDHHSHRLLFDSVSRLVEETGEIGLESLFDRASALHINFYENHFNRAEVARRISDVERFVDKVAGLLP